jgi:excisionase family DNA binding protein
MQNNQDIKPMLTANEVARLLNVHMNTVRRWSNRGNLRTYRIGSRGDRRFEQEDVIQLLIEQSKLVT